MRFKKQLEIFQHIVLVYVVAYKFWVVLEEGGEGMDGAGKEVSCSDRMGWNHIQKENKKMDGREVEGEKRQTGIRGRIECERRVRGQKPLFSLGHSNSADDPELETSVDSRDGTNPSFYCGIEY